MSTNESRPSRQPKLIFTFVAGLAVGGLGGGVAGYVVNDLTSRENEEVMADIRETEETQDELQGFLDSLEEPAADDSASGE